MILSENADFKIVKYKNHKHISIENNSDYNSFKELFKYIEGDNNGRIKFDMTSPVLQKFHTADNKDISEMFFFIFLEDGNDILPNPTNKKVKVRNLILKDKYFAQIKYTKFIFDFNKKDEKKYTELIKKINNYKFKNKKLQYNNNNKYFKASYNSPFTLIQEFEIWVELEDFIE